MLCSMPGCGSQAIIRSTGGECIALFCLRHLALACDLGFPEDKLVVLPEPLEE